MQVFTIMKSHWRVARNRDIVFMDTTVAVNNSVFAPTWDMVLGYKAYRRQLEHPEEPLGKHAPIDEATYTRLYHERMNQSWKENRQQWLSVIESNEPMAIACFCAPGEFCHRHLLKDIFEKLCAARGIEFLYYGELLPDKK